VDVYRPFLRFVSNVTDFDSRFEAFTKEDYVTSKLVDVRGTREAGKWFADCRRGG